MQTASPDLDRKVVPRWRSVDRTPTAELENHAKATSIDPAVATELRRRIQTWEQDRDDLSAEELVWASTVFGPTAENTKALSDIVRAATVSRRTQKAADALLNGSSVGQLDLDLDVTSTREALRRLSGELRGRIRAYPRDVLAQIHLAMLYNRLGQPKQAERFVLAAVTLAPNSRYVVRAASRFYVHVKRYDRAISILERSNLDDPWVQASRVTLHDLADVPINGMKHVRALLQRDLPPKHMSELAGALGTLEFKNGSVGRAKKLFRLGAIEPGDNMVAQLQWASRQHLGSLREGLLRQSLTFEARAAAFQLKKQWASAVESCSEWLRDEPFSIRPANTGSFLAAELLHDYERSIEFCEYGRIANPNDFGLLNNQAFSLAGLNRIEPAKEFLAEAYLRVRTPEERIIAIATEGMIEFRNGNADLGATRYQQSIDEARRLKHGALALAAFVHYVAEACRTSDFLSNEEKETISRIFEGPKISESIRDLYSARLAPFLTRANSAGSADRPSRILETLVM